MEVNVKVISEYLTSIDINNEVIGNSNLKINGFSSLFNYKEGTMTFIVPERRVGEYLTSDEREKIKLIIMSSNETDGEGFQSLIRVSDPRKAFFKAIDKFFDNSPNEDTIGITSEPEKYKKHSFISREAKIGKNVKIGIGCVIEGDVEIGENTEIHHNVVIRNKTKIGRNCTIFSGTVIGERGFNVFRYEDGTKEMVKHYGGIVIEDDVHIGDNCCIIQGAIDDTIIKRGVKLNTMVHVAHNVIIGENTIVTAPTHICGSVIIGRNCHIAATIIRNQVKIGDNSVLGLGSVVVKDVDAGITVVGNPAKPLVKKD